MPAHIPFDSEVDLDLTTDCFDAILRTVLETCFNGYCNKAIH